jgi:SesB domain on fungal death-pathway protein
MQTTFTGSRNEGLQIGQNPGTVNVNFAGATDMGRLSFYFMEFAFHLY